MIKKIFLTLLVLLIVLILAAVALVMFVDVNRFKPQIESFVQERYQRTLSIDGDLSLSVFPSIAVALPKMALSAPKTTDKAIGIDSARVSVKLLPLLQGQVQADVVSLDGLQADITRNKDGSTNIDDLLGGPAAAADEPATPAAADESATPLAINIGGVELTNANITFNDLAAGSKFALSQFNLKTGAIADNATTPVELSADVSSTNPAMKFAVVLESALKLQLAEQQVQADNLQLSINGQFDGMPIEQTLEIKDLKANPGEIIAGLLTTNTLLKQTGRTVTAKLSTPLQMDLNRGAIALSTLSGQIDLDDKAVAPEPLNIPFDGSLKANTKTETANVVLNLSAQEVALNTRVDVKGFATPAINFDIKADKINLDKLLPASEPAADKPAATEKTAAAPEAPIDLSALKPLVLDGKVTVGELIASGAKVSDLALTMKARKGLLTLAPITAKLYEGALQGKASVNANGNKVAAALGLTGIQIGPLLTDAADTDLLEGKGDVTVDITTGGATVSAMKQGLNGKAALRLADGAIKGINLGEKIREAKSLLQGGNESQASQDNVRTDFSALSASFDIVNGVASSTDLDGKSPLLRLSGEGKVDIPASTLDYLAKATVVGTSKGQGGKEVNELSGLTIPVRLTGSFDQLAWAIDWSVAAKEFAKSKAAEKLGVDQATIDAKKAELKEQAQAKEDELKAKAREREDELKEKAKSKLEDKLKKLF